jgi:hypothetical protein
MSELVAIILFLCVSIFLYADDILLLAPSVNALQSLLSACEEELLYLDMQINVKKSMCIRFGQRYNVECKCLRTISGGLLPWVNECRYLGIYFVSGRTLRCSFSQSKVKFYKAFNSIFSKVGRAASEEVVISLMRSKCVSVLLYGLEACPLRIRDKQSLDFSVTRCFMKLFRTGSASVVSECQNCFNFLPVSCQIDIKTTKFLQKFSQTNNIFCLLFADLAGSSAEKIFKSYGSGIQSWLQLKRFIGKLYTSENSNSV